MSKGFKQSSLAKRNPVLVISIVAGCALFIVGGYLFLTVPRYMVLKIESPSSYLPGGDWRLTSVSTYNFPNRRGRYFVWRQEAEVRTQTYDPRSPFDSWLSLKEYFDDRLTDDEWALYQSDLYNPCILYFPEAKFLPQGVGGYLIYRKPGTIAYAAEPTICLAIWPSREDENENVNAYHVVILTVNPSIIAVWGSQLDLGW